MRDHANEVIEEMRKRGINPAQPTRQQYAMCALAVRTRKEVVDDAKSVAGSVTRTRVLGLRVLPQKSQANREQCLKNECGKLQKLKGGKVACGWCNCQEGLGLESKWEDPFEFCPGGYWSNLT